MDLSVLRRATPTIALPHIDPNPAAIVTTSSSDCSPPTPICSLPTNAPATGRRAEPRRPAQAGPAVAITDNRRQAVKPSPPAAQPRQLSPKRSLLYHVLHSV